MDVEEFRRVGHQLIDWIAGYRSGMAYLTPAQLDDRWMVRVSIGANPTEREHVQALWQLMRQEAEHDGL